MGEPSLTNHCTVFLEKHHMWGRSCIALQVWGSCPGLWGGYFPHMKGSQPIDTIPRPTLTTPCEFCWHINYPGWYFLSNNTYTNEIMSWFLLHISSKCRFLHYFNELISHSAFVPFQTMGIYLYLILAFENCKLILVMFCQIWWTFGLACVGFYFLQHLEKATCRLDVLSDPLACALCIFICFLISES